MDDDDLRRGRPTCHKAFDEATAVLAGDGLLTLAFEVLARHVRPAEAAVGCVRVLAEAAGPAGMVGGQMADLQAEGRERRHASRPSRRSTAARPARCSARACAWGRSSPAGREAALDALDIYGRPSAWPSRSSTTCSTCRATRRSWASGWARTRVWASGPTRASWGSRGAAAGPSNWPTRRSRPWPPWGSGPRLAGPGPGSSGKGSLMSSTMLPTDRVAGRPASLLRQASSTARRRDARGA